MADGIIQNSPAAEAHKSSRIPARRKSSASVLLKRPVDDAGERSAIPTNGFIEELYLALNPDVADAINASKFSNAWEHWAQFGQHETDEGDRPALKHEVFYAEPKEN